MILQYRSRSLSLPIFLLFFIFSKSPPTTALFLNRRVESILKDYLNQACSLSPGWTVTEHEKNAIVQPTRVDVPACQRCLSCISPVFHAGNGREWEIEGREGKWGNERDERIRTEGKLKETVGKRWGEVMEKGRKKRERETVEKKGKGGWKEERNKWGRKR